MYTPTPSQLAAREYLAALERDRLATACLDQASQAYNAVHDETEAARKAFRAALGPDEGYALPLARALSEIARLREEADHD